MRLRVWSAGIALLLCASAPLRAEDTVTAASSQAGPPPAVLSVGGAVATPLRLDQQQWAAMPRQTLKATEKGDTAEWQGVALLDLLRMAGAPAGDSLRGPALALVVRVTAADGYRVVFTPAELDPAFGKTTVLLADRRNGEPLDAHIGPLRLVVPGDSRPARWVRQVVAIDVVALP